MIDPSLALQETLFQRLKHPQTISELINIPVLNVLDTSRRPEAFPRVVIGDGHTQFPDYENSFHIKTWADIHVWTRNEDLASAKKIAGAVREAIWKGPWTVEGHRCVNLLIEQSRFLREGKDYQHAVITVAAILQEEAQPR